MDLRGVKSDKNRVPVRLVFCCKFAEDDFILEVESDNRFVKRYVNACLLDLQLCTENYHVT